MLRGISIFSALLLLSSPFTAANEPEEDFDSLLNMSIFDIVNLKVSSTTLTETTIESSPAAVTVFTKFQLDTLGIDYLHELLALVPGYQTARAMDYSYQYSLSARGLKSGPSGREVLFLIDDIPVNDSRNGSIGGAFLFPISKIEKIEIIRGPGSSLYGSNAFSGVVSISTIKDVNKVSLSIGNFNHRGLSIAASRHFNKWTVNFSAQLDQDAGDTYLVDNSFASGEVLTRDPAKQSSVSLAIENNQSKLNFVHRQITSNEFFNTGRISNEYNLSDRYFDQVNLKHKFDITSDLTTKVLLSYIRMSTRNGNQSTPAGAFAEISVPPSNEPLYGIGKFVSSRWLLNIQSDWTINADSSLQFGAEFRESQLNKSRGYTNYDLADLTSGIIPIRYYSDLSQYVLLSPEIDVNAGAIYTQYQVNLNEHWYGTFGARYDNYSDFPSRISPRGAVVYKPSSNNIFKVIYGEAFRVPDFNENNLGNTLTVAGNPNLTHAIVKTWDLIWLKKWKQSQVQVGLFDNRYIDPIVSSVIDGVRTFINSDNQSGRGIEAEANLQISPQWFVKLSAHRFWSLPDSAFRENREAFSLMTNYRFNKLNINLAASYSGERQMINRSSEQITLPDYWLVSSKISYQWQNQWQLNLKIKNLLDQEYQTPTSGNTLEQGIPNRGRSVSLGVKFEF